MQIELWLDAPKQKEAPQISKVIPKTTKDTQKENEELKEPINDLEDFNWLNTDHQVLEARLKTWHTHMTNLQWTKANNSPCYSIELNEGGKIYVKFYEGVDRPLKTYLKEDNNFIITIPMKLVADLEFMNMLNLITALWTKDNKKFLKPWQGMIQLSGRGVN